MLEGWSGSHNSIAPSMEKSMDNAEGIIDYYKNKLTQHQGDHPGILNLLNDVTPKADQLLLLCGKYSGDISAKLAQTSDKKSLVSDMKEKLHGAMNVVIPVHGIGTLGYESIYAGGTDKLYNGPYNEIVAGLQGLANNMTANGAAAGALIINTYRLEIIDRHNHQVNAIQLITDDSILMESLVVDLGKIINCGRSWLVYHFGMEDGYEAIVNSYFPLNLLRAHPTGHYQRMLPAGEFRRMCIHLFKTGEKAEIIVGDKDVWLSTADDANHPLATGYHALAGSHVTIDPLLLGNPLKKYIIATNTDLTTATDVVFNIIKP